MISTMWTLAPAGARGPVGSVVPTAACAVESPVAVRLRALPAAIGTTALIGTRVPGVFGTRVFGIDVVATPASGALGTTDYAQQVSKRSTTEQNGTTLGIHSSRRPAS
ncbi:hypothetical protein [Geodermatophilus sp. SYSU D01176]